MIRVSSAFVGCKVSQADSEQALAEMLTAGLRPALSRTDAEVVVVHTCCVTSEAERKSRQLVRRLAREGRRVVVAGCAATLRPQQFVALGLEVCEGQPDWAAVARRLAAPITSAAGHLPAAAAPAAASHAARSSAAATRTRLTLKVQDGCAARCSYCAVRLVRGRPRSTALRDVLAAARAGLATGCGEVVLSGIDLGAWRDGGERLPDLVAALLELPELARLRLSSLEPGQVDDRLLEVLDHPRAARHLHLPLQSADDGVLAAMRRPYTFAEYREITARARARRPGVLLSTDVIVGFPAEDEAAFARTVACLRSGLFGRVHVFAFSPRPGTAAAELPPLPAAVVKERMRRALAAAAAAAQTARLAMIGRHAEVLVEERRDGLYKGYSSEYVRYYLHGVAELGSLVRAVADRTYRDGLGSPSWERRHPVRFRRPRRAGRAPRRRPRQAPAMLCLSTLGYVREA